MNLYLSAANYIIDFYFISHTILYKSLVSWFIFFIFYIEPLFIIIYLIISSVHKSYFIKSSTKYLLTQINSPDNTLLIYKFDVNGSKFSLLPYIWDVDAVGINAINKELRIPYYFKFSFTVVQS
jgi:hypothetical protein